MLVSIYYYDILYKCLYLISIGALLLFYIEDLKLLVMSDHVLLN